MKFFVSKNEEGERLDIFLTRKMKIYSRSYIKNLIQNKKVLLNKESNITQSAKLKVNDKIKVDNLILEKNDLVPKKIMLNTIYEDKDILIINKPKGMVVHPGSGNYDNTLANALAYKYKKNLSNINGKLRPGIVHRIDKETSGLLVIAKNNYSHSKLAKQFSDHSIKRKYQCLVWGTVRPLNGRIETLIARDKRNRQLMTVSEINGKKAITNYKTVKVFSIKDIPRISLIECELETGRTHQIRVHLKYKGSSLLGDFQYGKKNNQFKKVDKFFLEKLKKIKGQALHAQTLEFVHPTKNEWVQFQSKIPADFKKMLNFLDNLAS